MKPNLAVVYLKPAEMYIASSPSIVKTVLGSCVSVTMFNPRMKVGAICHGMLPRCKEKPKGLGKCPDGLKYVDYSIKHMLMEFRSLGIGNHEIEVKLFGGADMFTTGVGEKETVGAQNIKVALKMFEEEHLNLRKSDTGGSRGRKIFFHTDTGEIFLKRLGVRDTALIDKMLKVKNRR